MKAPSTLWTIYYIAGADFLERVRRYSFLITLGLMILAAYIFMPAADARYVALDLGGYRGLYNSAWLGSSVAVLTSLFQSLFGFYLVKNIVERDEQTGVGQIIATTPLRKIAYILGKALSNFAVLALIVGIVLVAAGIGQFLHGEDLQLDLAALAVPFLVITLPAMAVVAALAILFETLPALRSGLGNIVYFVVWLTLIGVEGAVIILGAGGLAALVDPLGITVPILAMLVVARALPGYNGNAGVGPYPLEGDPLKTFRWEGMPWTTEIIPLRLVWVAVALAILLLATRLFDRFASSREIVAGKPAMRKPKGSPRTVPKEDGRPPLHARLGPLPTTARRFRWVPMLWAELRLLLKGRRWWWYAGGAVIVIVGLVSPADVARQVWLPVAWAWPILIWSSLGIREEHYRTSQLIFSAPQPVLHQLPVTWLSGLTLSLLAGSGVALALGRAGDWAALGAWLAGALFIPSLALALGVWSSSNKLFEVVYLLLWYIGPLHPQEMPWLDFMGATDSAIALGMPLVYLALAVFLLGVAVMGRWRQVVA